MKKFKPRDDKKKHSRIKLDILLKDYELINQKIEQFLKYQVHHFYVGAGLVFGLSALFSKLNTNKGDIAVFILYLIPITLLLYFGVIMYHYQRTYALQGYKKYLEKKINEIAGEKLIFYGEIGFKYMEKKNKFVVFNMLSNVLLFVISVVLVILSMGDSLCLIYVMGFLTLLLFIFFIWALLSVKGTADFFYDESEKLNDLGLIKFYKKKP